MTRKRWQWAAALAAALGLPGLAAAQEGVWRAVARTPGPPVVVASTAPAAEPVVRLGRPVPLAAPRPLLAAVPHLIVRGQAAESSIPPPAPPVPPGDEGITPTAGTAPLQPPVPDPLLGDPPGTRASTHTVSQPADPAPPPPAAPFPADPGPGVATEHPVAPGFWEKCRGWLAWGDQGSVSGRSHFQSDTCFPCMISPVTMPFYFEDPRALTEIRPIFMYQSLNKNHVPWSGGNAYFYGTQARLAITDRLSFVLNELGGISFDPKDPLPPAHSGSGFAEVKLGPKFTFLRSSDTGSVAAAGLTFEIPTGSKGSFQDTGRLGLNPYVTYGQTFGRLPNGFGTINYLTTLGYEFATDDRRSEFFHWHHHLDYNVANTGFFPLIEFNWIRYTKAGNNIDLGTEGADLINFGSSSRKGKDFFSLAGGLRYRFSDHVILGSAFEFPLSGERGAETWRLTFDIIFRY